jgi:hypothetical protein
MEAEPSLLDAHLMDAAETGSSIEVILVLRGRVRRAGARWRFYIAGHQQRVTFPWEAVVAVTSRAARSRGR